MEPRVGQSLVSTVDTTAVIVIKAPPGDVAITCGGAPMIDKDADPVSGEADPALMQGTLLGKRYVHATIPIELLCTKAGDGTLAVDGTPLTIASARPLPASD